MLQVAKDLERLKITTKDGEIGYTFDFLFDDSKWIIRYLVVDTGNWLTGRKILISPHSISEVNLNNKSLKIDLTKDQIENSPNISEKKPVSRQNEKVIVNYYGWPIYWSVNPSFETIGIITEGESEKNNSDPHLRSMREVRDYNIQATDGDAGHIDSFILDDKNWIIKYLILDTRKWLHWLPGGKFVLISPGWIDKIEWSESTAYLELDQYAIEQSPDYDPSIEIDERYENKLYDCYKAYLDRKYEKTS